MLASQNLYKQYMPRLVIISNRLPVTINRKDGELHYHPSAGGLATGLNSLDQSLERIWIGWPGQEVTDPEEQEVIRKDLIEEGLVPVFLTQKEISLYYEGFSNKTIWPHFHYFTQYTTYNDEYWDAYQEANRKFADATIPLIRPDDLVWVHDYQLMLLPAMIREAFPKVSIGFFLHIPFPSYEVFRVLPWRKEILEGVLGADQIGFHTFNYMRHFLSASYRIAGFEHNFGKLTVGDRLINVDVFPMGIDYEKYAFPEVHQAEEEDNDSSTIIQLAKGRKLIISIDRLDYSKGIPNRLLIFEKFLKKYPEYHRKVTLVMVVVPSRANVDQYQELKETVDKLVGNINGQYSKFDWTPIKYFYRSLDFSELITLYQEGDIALITPLRDGMNLVAKEFVACKEKTKDGVLILSEMAGASNELMDALIVNPQDANGIVDAIHEALIMPESERRARLTSMQEKLKKYNVRHWAATFFKEQKKLMEKQQDQQTHQMSADERAQLLSNFHSGKKRLLMLDYDGTLMGFHNDPQAVQPDQEVLGILEELAGLEGTQVVVNSGRDRHTLHEWLGHLPIHFAAEHGVWVKKSGDWKINSSLNNKWKKEIRPVLENLVERTPGSFIEEKDYSIAWHYRRIDRDLGEKRVREFRDVLLYLTHNLDLQVLEGNKVVEIKNAGVNKGKATDLWLNGTEWDFILAIGDDHTDEDIFKALPESAFTIKVGLDRSIANYSLPGVKEVRGLLKELLANR